VITVDATLTEHIIAAGQMRRMVSGGRQWPPSHSATALRGGVPLFYADLFFCEPIFDPLVLETGVMSEFINLNRIDLLRHVLH